MALILPSHWTQSLTGPTFLNEIKESYNITFQKERRNICEQKHFTINMLLISLEFISSHARGLSFALH